MSNNKLICFRVDDEQKARIEAAAGIQGKSVTTFVKELVMNAVKQFETRPAKQPKQHTGVPTYFKALCHEAGQGGSFGFRAVGYQFASMLGSEVPIIQSLDGWQDELNALGQMLKPVGRWGKPILSQHAEISASVWGWFTKNYPNAMKLIPDRRRDQFLLGVLDAYADETIGLNV